MKADASEAIRRGQGREQFSNLGTLVPHLCRDFIEGDRARAVRCALQAAHTKPSKSRGLGYAPDLCQVNSVPRANAEIEHDCWRFTLKGAKHPDKRPWAAILASGDNKRIEFAERLAFLDWENPDADAVETRSIPTARRAPATRRPWSPPITKAS